MHVTARDSSCFSSEWLDRVVQVTIVSRKAISIDTTSRFVMPSVYAFKVRNANIKHVKSALEGAQLLHKEVKIRAEQDAHSTVPTLIEVEDVAVTALRENNNEHSAVPFDFWLNLNHFPDDVADLHDHVESVIVLQVDAKHGGHKARSALEAAVGKALSLLDAEQLPCTPEELLSIMPSSYSTYQPMLLLPFHCFRHNHWQSVMSYLNSDQCQRKRFFATIAAQMSVSNIAINAIIPAENIADSHEATTENILRSPTNLLPMFGDFGPPLPAYPQHNPSSSDFSSAFWVSTKQNGIHQTWAPRYTMFSAGNVTEKARILTMPSVVEAARVGSDDGRGWTALDLFAGIGYFAFSYAKSGATKVLCWDLNPWSIEGLAKGAIMNKWGCRVFDFEADGRLDAEYEQGDKVLQAALDNKLKLLAFRETNEEASRRIAFLGASVPPIRHVNCGTLPTIAEAWKTAARALDPRLGGWVHLHETVPQAEMRQRGEHYCILLLQYMYEHSLYKDEVIQVHLEHIEVVKSIGPRLMHVVFDIAIRRG